MDIEAPTRHDEESKGAETNNFAIAELQSELLQEPMGRPQLGDVVGQYCHVALSTKYLNPTHCRQLRMRRDFAPFSWPRVRLADGHVSSPQMSTWVQHAKSGPGTEVPTQPNIQTTVKATQELVGTKHRANPQHNYCLTGPSSSFDPVHTTRRCPAAAMLLSPTPIVLLQRALAPPE